MNFIDFVMKFVVTNKNLRTAQCVDREQTVNYWFLFLLFFLIKNTFLEPIPYVSECHLIWDIESMLKTETLTIFIYHRHHLFWSQSLMRFYFFLIYRVAEYFGSIKYKRIRQEITTWVVEKHRMIEIIVKNCRRRNELKAKKKKFRMRYFVHIH